MVKSGITSRRQVTAMATLAVCLLLGGAAGSASPRPRTSVATANLCRAAEEVIFTCTVGAKIVSLCGGAEQNASYRFGTAAAPEIALSSGSAGSAARFGVAQTGYSGGGEAQVQVTNGRTQYIVYSRIVRTGFGPGGNDPQAEAGVSVRQDDHTIATRRCTGASASADLDVAAAQRHMPQASFVDDDE